MTELLTSAQMRAIEQSAIESGETTGVELMERAGRGVVDAIFEEWPQMRKGFHRAIILCGPGNNGGDGFVVARLLKEWGWEVEVFLYGDANKLPADARSNYVRWLELGDVQPFLSLTMSEENKCCLLIDALFGSGLTRALPKEILDKFAIISGRKERPYKRRYKKCVAIDFPSGLETDSGRFLQIDYDSLLCADLTVTFCMPKIGHYLENAQFFCKKVIVKPLGLKREEFIERGLYNEPEDDRRVSLLDRKLFGKITPFMNILKKHHSWNKYHCGHAYILSGPSTKTGAARLAARGCLRIGAGVVTIGAPKDALGEHAAQLNAVMLDEVNGIKSFNDKVLGDERINAICVGPAFGVKPSRKKLLHAVLQSKLWTVIDADALTLIANDESLFELLHEKCVLTPHGGEFARLFPDIAKKMNETSIKAPVYSKIDATREAAKRSGCVVLFKGADTVIAAPDGRCALNSAYYEREATWLATAGSGDVLAGFITGLLAREFGAMQAAETAAWLHVKCALKFGAGLIAEDIPEQLPKVFSDLGL